MSTELNRRLDAMVRGWEPSVEEALIEHVGAGRATRLTLTYADSFPDYYRNRTSPEEAAQDILRLNRLADDGERDARLYRRNGRWRASGCASKCIAAAGSSRCRMRFRCWRILAFACSPKSRSSWKAKRRRISMTACSSCPTACRSMTSWPAPSVIEQAIADVLAGKAENDAFNQLVLYAGLEPRPVVWLRAWFRYMRQTGVAFSLATVVDALRRAPKATRALVGLFAAAHDPKASNRPRRRRRSKPRHGFDEALKDVRGIDDDRILRQMRAVIGATLRTNAFAPPAAEALAFKIDSASRSRACRRRSPIAKSGSTARASREFICAAARSPAAACAGPTGATTSAPKSWG